MVEAALGRNAGQRAMSNEHTGERANEQTSKEVSKISKVSEVSEVNKKFPHAKKQKKNNVLEN